MNVTFSKEVIPQLPALLLDLTRERGYLRKLLLQDCNLDDDQLETIVRSMMTSTNTRIPDDNAATPIQSSLASLDLKNSSKNSSCGKKCLEAIVDWLFGSHLDKVSDAENPEARHQAPNSRDDSSIKIGCSLVDLRIIWPDQADLCGLDTLPTYDTNKNSAL